MRFRCLTIAVAVISFGEATWGQDKEALILPEDEQLYDDITGVGASERLLRSGLSRVTVPASDTIYYVVDEADALHGDLAEGFADIRRNDSDISIWRNRLRSEFVHIRVRGSAPEVRYLETALMFSTSQFFRDGGFSGGNRSIEFLEYPIPTDECPDAGAGIERIQELLRDVVTQIGPPQEPLQTIPVDGIGYGLRLRLGYIQASLRKLELT